MREVWLSATWRRITIIALLSVLMVAFGTLGYMTLQGYSLIEGLYMTVITLAAVGYSEVRPLDDVGRLFTIILILMGVSFVAFTLAYLSQVLIDGNLLDSYRRRRLKKQLDRLSNHYIVCGFGQMGQIIVNELQKYQIPLLVIENEESALHRLREKDIPHIAGDATDEDHLSNAGIARAKGLVAVVNKDSENVFIVLTARDLNKDLRILARASTAGSEYRLIRAGADRIVSPYALGATRIVHNIVRPTVTDFLELALSGEGMELRMEEFVIPPSSKLVGMELVKSGVRADYNLIVIAIKRGHGKMIFNPVPREVFHADDIMITVGPAEDLTRFGRDLCDVPDTGS